MSDVAIFTADVHLKPDEARQRDRFLSFLEQVCSRTKALYILGDLFDVWFLPSHPDFPGLQPVVQALKRLAAAGVELHFFYGNRDYYAGSYMAEQVGAIVHPDGAFMTVQGRQLYVSHGDLLCSLDRAYRFVRGLIRSRFINWVFMNMPAEVNFYFANGLRRYSRRAVERKTDRIMGVSLPAVCERFAGGAEMVVCGHVHKTSKYVLNNNVAGGSKSSISGALYTLGDWREHGSYIEMVDGRMRFRWF